MNVTPENIIVNSCEYTPIYLIPSTSVTQAGSYIITQSNQDGQKPIADNLKTFYENSGNLESGILSSPKPRILKKQSASVVGNNLKLASFLLPKSESVNIQNIQTSISNVNIQTSIQNVQTIQANVPNVQPVPAKQLITPVTPISNVIMKPAATAVSAVVNSNSVSSNTNKDVDCTLPRVEIDRKIVRVGTIPSIKRTHHYPNSRVLPKNKPKEKIDPNPPKLTSVQLIKLGETYHSVNQLSDDQMKIVNKALKMFGDEKMPKEPAYDPVTNTKFIYKVVSPRDLTVVGRNKMVKKKTEAKKHAKVLIDEDEFEDLLPVEVTPKVTRSGRTVKLPKQMRQGGVSPQKPRKKAGSVVNCFQCSAEFCSFYRLQRHYEMFPTHIPARIHSNLFHCLLAIIKGGGEGDQANIFIQQLEHLVEKLKSLWPCLLKKMDGKEGKTCSINEDISRLLGFSPGKYNINIDALNCIKDIDGHCIHNPAPKNSQFNSDVSKPSQMWLSKHNEEIANNVSETEDCARINSVDKWPTATKRIWKLKQQRNAKRMRIKSECEQPIELGTEDLSTFSKSSENSAINIAKKNGSLEELTLENINIIEPTVQEPIEKITTNNENQNNKPKTYSQFHSTHFDIRSSPIKLPSSLARKFQFNQNEITNFEAQILRPLAQDTETIVDETQPNDPQEIYNDHNIELPKEPVINNELSFDTAKDWSIDVPNESEHDSFMKSNILFQAALTPEKNTTLIEPSLMHMNHKQDCLLVTPSKLVDENLLQINDKSDSLIEPSLLHVDDKTNDLFGSNQTSLHVKDEATGFYEPSSIHVKPKCNSLIGSSMINLKGETFESALSHVKERSNNLFSTSILQPRSKSHSLNHIKDDNSIFDTELSHLKERSNSLFESSLMSMKGKDSLIGPTLLQDDNSNLFPPSMSLRKDDDMMEQSLINNKPDRFIQGSLLHNGDIRDPVNVDVNHADICSNDSRLLPNPGQSVLNFLESLGNESLSLAYPETEIRNNSVDFQLDLFSFNNT